MSSTLALSSTSCSLNRPNALLHFPSRTTMSIANSPSSYSTLSATTTVSSWKAKAEVAVQHHRRRRMMICSCEVALRSSVDKEAEEEASASTSSPATDDTKAKIGARIRVTMPLKVHHVPRVPEVDLTGMEGVVKQYVAIWKGKRISANLPYKVEFVTDIQGRGPVKFFAHLKEDEFEYMD